MPLNHRPGRNCELCATLPPTLEAGEEFIARLRACYIATGFKRVFAAELVVREVLANAIVHGCGGDSSKQVFCLVRIRPTRLTIRVQDQGDGFDWRTVHQARAEDCSGRGIEILRRYGARVRFNKQGNCLTVIVNGGNIL
jgi:anti-sigma regulatory factor (Ser/Thr protein kinase)